MAGDGREVGARRCDSLLPARAVPRGDQQALCSDRYAMGRFGAADRVQEVARAGLLCRPAQPAIAALEDRAVVTDGETSARAFRTADPRQGVRSWRARQRPGLPAVAALLDRAQAANRDAPAGGRPAATRQRAPCRFLRGPMSVAS